MKKIISVICIFAIVFSLMAGMGVNSNAMTDVWESEPNENPNQTNSLAFNQIMHGNTMGYQYGSNDDHFKISIQTDVNFKIKFDHEIDYTYGSGWDLMLYKLNASNNGYYDYFDNKQYSAYQYNYYDKVISNQGVSYSPVIVAKKGDIFIFRVMSEYGGKQQQNVNYMISLEPVISKPSSLKCTARTTSAEKVAWNKVSGVTGYQVQCSDGGSKWAQTKTGTGTSATFKGLTAGGKYKFRVRAYKDIEGTRYYSAWSPVLDSCAKPATVKIESVSSPKKAQIKTTWAKAGGVATGYQIAYYKNAKCTSLACCKYAKSQKTTSYTLTKASSGKIFYTRVRAYTNFGGKTYWGAWSKAIKVKVK